MSKSIARSVICWCAGLLAAVASQGTTRVASTQSNALGSTLAIDLSEPSPAGDTPIEAGTCKSPDGHVIGFDRRSLFLDGKPWIPVAGEMHYTRYPREEWRDALLKIKAGGITVVSTYVFWIHHEEREGVWDWSGNKSLRDFVQTAQAVGLKVIVRMGPWCHGEVRNGGLPDWVQNSSTKLRHDDPAFLALVKPLFEQEAEQMRGLLWKDGGPIIGVQLDNECTDGRYLLALKQMARDAGVDVPLYTITGWQGGVPAAGLLPLFGGYVDGFWGGSLEKYRREFLFTPMRDVSDLGAQLTTRKQSKIALLEQFPYLCAEIGPGMMSSYHKRTKILPDDAAALSLAKLGSGNNMPGYYMYQGGVNPDGALSTLQEAKPNAMPIKDYDFDTAIGACGQVREVLGVLREQNLFLQDFGAQLARMPAFFPAIKPRGLEDFDTLRWAVRSDGHSSFLFFSNRQPAVPLPEHPQVQFALNVGNASNIVPATPIDLPSWSYGIWPVAMDCEGVHLNYATAQPICRLSASDGAIYFFAAIDGVRSELSIEDKPPLVVSPGTTPAVTLADPSGKKVTFVVLTSIQSRQLVRTKFAGHDVVAFSNAALFSDDTTLRLQTEQTGAVRFDITSTVASTNLPQARFIGKDGIFDQYEIAAQDVRIGQSIIAHQTKQAGPLATNLTGTDEKTWLDAAEYDLPIPPMLRSHHDLLKIQYTGDAARVYVGDRLFLDNFFNGDPFDVPLWRIASSDRSRLHLKILPYSEALMSHLPDEAKQAVSQAQANGTVNAINVTISELRDVRLGTEETRP